MLANRFRPFTSELMADEIFSDSNEFTKAYGIGGGHPFRVPIFINQPQEQNYSNFF